MNRIDVQQAGGFPLETDTLAFFQSSFTALQSLVALGGDNFILSGCNVEANSTSDGWIVYNGELLPFKGGLTQTRVVVKEVSTNRGFENGANKPVFFERTMQFGTGDNSVLFSDLTRIKNLKTFKNLPHQASDRTDLDSSEYLATSKALKSVYDLLKNQVPSKGVIIWSGFINEIPAGWALCDGLDGRPNLIDVFVLGAGNKYAVGSVGGAERHLLTTQEIPNHSHQISGIAVEGDKAFNDGGGSARFGRGNMRTEGEGGGQSHNNMPPYYSLAYIVKL